MAKLTNKGTSGTSFFFTVIGTTVNDLISILGEPQHLSINKREKVQVDFECETENGDVFTIYDWKEYKDLDLNGKLLFHIGGKSKEVTEQALKELTQMLQNKNKKG